MEEARGVQIPRGVASLLGSLVSAGPLSMVGSQADTVIPCPASLGVEGLFGSLGPSQPVSNAWRIHFLDLCSMVFSCFWNKARP